MTYSAIIAGHRGLPGAAVRTADGSCGWPELLGRTTSAVRWLEEIGADPGEPVAALVTTSTDVIALTLAAAAAGKPLAPLGPRLTERELVPCVRGIGATVLVAEPAWPPAIEIAVHAGDRYRLIGLTPLQARELSSALARAADMLTAPAPGSGGEQDEPAPARSRRLSSQWSTPGGYVVYLFKRICHSLHPVDGA